MKNNATVLILLTAALLSAVSCGSTENSTEKTKDTPETQADNLAVQTEETAPVYLDSLPAGLDLGGKAVNFLYRDEVKEEFYADTDSGDIVNDAINASIRSVEERLNTDIVLIAKAGHLVDARDGYMNDITNSVLAGDHLYDWVDLMIGNSPLRAQDGIFANLLENPRIDLSQPWYIPGLADTVSINGQLYFVSGDASLGYMKCAYCMYFNKSIAEQYDLTDLYETVKSGKWTLEKLMEYASLTSRDLDNNGKYDLSDQLGFVDHDLNHPKGFIRSCDINVFAKDADGAWYFSLGSSRDQSVMEKLHTLKAETPGSYFYNGTNAVKGQLDDYGKISSMFCTDQIFIISAEMDDAVSQFREMKAAYGILPFPKFEEAQSAYYTISRNTHNAFSMPTTCADPEAAGAVLEALSSSNYQKVFPTYFETAMKNKYASAPEDSEIFDLIHGSMVLDFGYIYSNAIGGIYDATRDVMDKPGNFASFVTSKTKSVTKELDKYVQKIIENSEN